jgi:acyl transferase domain-containing protein
MNKAQFNPGRGRSVQEPLAVTGMSCRFPGGIETPAQYWKFLHAGRSGISEVPPDRWALEELFSPTPGVAGKTTLKVGGFIDNPGLFDAAAFSIKADEAAAMDPQHRIALELARDAIEDANILLDSSAGSNIGVFLGLSSFEYFYRFVQRPLSRLNAHVGLGNSMGVAAGRIAFAFGFHGPCMVIDATCASSLVAVHLAAQSLRNGECTAALAGGVHLMLSPVPAVIGSQANMVSVQGQCRPFDAAADGFLRGEGGGFVVLKLLSRALEDGDAIRALIPGTAAGQNGASFGLGAPSSSAQKRLIEQALSNAGVEPSEVDYVEAHGTGTVIGDAIEVGALASVFGADRTQGNNLQIGSVKASIGHLEAAAGFAGLCKVILMLEQGQFVPSLNFDSPNPKVRWSRIPVSVSTATCDWKKDGIRAAGVNAFGFNGANAHVVVSQFSQPESGTYRKSATRGSHTLALTAPSPAALQKLARRHSEAMLQLHPPALDDYCFTNNTRRQQYRHRLAISASTPAAMANQLNSHADDRQSRLCRSANPTEGRKMAFVLKGYTAFGGHQGQALEAIPDLRREFVSVGHVVERFSNTGPGALAAALNGSKGTPAALPAAFCFEFACARLWLSWGLKPEIVMGYGIGELAAAAATGAVDVENMARFVTECARTIERRCIQVATLAIHTKGVSVPDLRAISAEFEVDIALTDGHGLWILSGERDRVARCDQHLRSMGVSCSGPSAGYPLHCPLLQPAVDEIRTAARGVRVTGTGLPWSPSLSGSEVSAEHWVEALSSPLEPVSSMDIARGLGCADLMDVASLAEPLAVLGSREVRCGTRDSSSYPGEECVSEAVLNTATVLFNVGYPIKWAQISSRTERRLVRIPTTPFDRQLYWSSVEGSPCHRTFDQHEQPEPPMGAVR